jgi:RND family efflux transporter MFP subunit
MRWFIAFLTLAITAMPVMAQEHGGSGRFRVQLTAYQQSSIASEIAANISSLPLKDGAAFNKGDLLVQFDCAIIESQLRKAEAVAESASSALLVSKRLSELKALSNLELVQSISKAKEAEADLIVMKVTASKCSIKAPFDGRVVKLMADPYQYVTPGKPLIDIVDTSRLEVKMLIPSRLLAWLKTGTIFSVQIEEMGGRSYSAHVVRIGAKIDALSQTAVIAGEIDGRKLELLPGMSGWATFGGGKRK